MVKQSPKRGPEKVGAREMFQFDETEPEQYVRVVGLIVDQANHSQ
jgi:hypothetical protein